MLLKHFSITYCGMLW